MENIPTKNTGDSLTAAEFNQIPDELENAITNTGITLSSGDLSQLSKAIANYTASGDFYTDTGAADAYVLSVIASKQGPTSYATGTRVRFIVGNTNTGASTINVNTIGVKNIKTNAGTDPAAGDLTAGAIIELEYDGTNFVLNVTTRLILHVQDQKVSGTNGGGSTGAAQNVRTLNTVVSNTIPGASLAANIITLPAGTYYIEASAPAHGSVAHKARLFNVTDATVDIVGTSAYADTVNSGETRSFIRGTITIAATKTFRVDHYITAAVGGVGLGSATSSGDIEVYADLMVTQE